MSALYAGWEPLPSRAVQNSLGAVLKSWEGTRYQEGVQCKGVSTDCVRFVCGVLDEVTGQSHELGKLPKDACFHSPQTAVLAAQKIRDAYEPIREIDLFSEKVRPGDVIMTGPRKGGPSHAMLVGCEDKVLWHCTTPRVQQVLMGALYVAEFKIFACYRLDLLQVTLCLPSC